MNPNFDDPSSLHPDSPAAMFRRVIDHPSPPPLVRPVYFLSVAERRAIDRLRERHADLQEKHREAQRAGRPLDAALDRLLDYYRDGACD